MARPPRKFIGPLRRSARLNPALAQSQSSQHLTPPTDEGSNSIADTETPTHKQLQPLERTWSPRLGFFDLPPEMRNMIYDLLCNFEVTIFVSDLRCSESPASITPMIAVGTGAEAIFRVSKLMELEAAPFAYRRKLFIAENLSDLDWFLTTIGDVGRANVEKLKFSWTKPGFHQTPSARKRARKIHTVVGRHDHAAHHPDEIMLKLQRCSRLKELTVFFPKHFFRRFTFPNTGQVMKKLMDTIVETGAPFDLRDVPGFVRIRDVERIAGVTELRAVKTEKLWVYKEPEKGYRGVKDWRNGTKLKQPILRRSHIFRWLWEGMKKEQVGPAPPTTDQTA